VIFDGIIGAAREQLGDFGPTVVEPFVRFDEHRILLRRPSVFAHVGV